MIDKTVRRARSTTLPKLSTEAGSIGNASTLFGTLDGGAVRLTTPFIGLGLS